jgi:hypothetical protein
MKNAWLAYLSTLMFFIAGIFMSIGGKPAIGVVFILISIASLVLNIYMNKKRD